MIISTYKIHIETMTCLLSYHDPPMKSLLGHPVKPIFFQHLDIIMLLLQGDISSMFGFDSAVDLGDRDHTVDDGWFDVVRFLAYSTSDSILGHIFVSVEIYRSSWSCMPIPTYEIHAETMTCLLSYHDLPCEPLLSHSVRPTLFGIWMSSCFLFWDTLIWFVDLI